MVEKEVEEEHPTLQPYDDLPSTDDAKGQRCYWFSVSNLYFRSVKHFLIYSEFQIYGPHGEEVPRCYTENTSKEELVLEHVLEY